MSDVNKLTPAEEERLALLSEECAEVIQAVSKILRHGYEAYNPLRMDSTTNRVDLTKELGDLKHAVQLLVGAGDVVQFAIDERAIVKSRTVRKYLHYQELGS